MVNLYVLYVCYDTRHRFTSVVRVSTFDRKGRGRLPVLSPTTVPFPAAQHESHAYRLVQVQALLPGPNLPNRSEIVAHSVKT